MEEEECWIKILQGLNVLPLIICILIGILFIGVGKGREFFSNTAIVCNFLLFDLFH
jgi:hypothetical protein